MNKESTMNEVLKVKGHLLPKCVTDWSITTGWYRPPWKLWPPNAVDVPSDETNS